MGELTDAVQDALTRAHGGAGAVVLVGGPGGSGLTHALGEAATAAAGIGLTVARATGREAERLLGFGVAVELVEELAGLGDPDRPGAPEDTALEMVFPGTGPDDGAIAVIRTAWALARRAPGGLAVIVDDLPDVDAPTLRLLAYGAVRLHDWPVALIAARRLGAEPADPAAVRAIARLSALITPPPLTAEAAVAIVRERLPDASAALCLACRHATGDNPGLLTALATDLAHTRGPTAELDPGRVQRTVGPAISAALQQRLARLPAPARRLAHTLSAHDGPLTTAQLEAASGLAPDAAGTAVDALVADGMLADAVPLRLAQPLLRTAIRASFTLAQRIRLAAATPPGPGAGTRSAGGSAGPTGAAALTPSEGRVAELAARGMTTKEIATALFVTPKTVEFHLRNVYRKLQIPSSRTDLAQALAAGARRPGPAGGISPNLFPAP